MSEIQVKGTVNFMGLEIPIVYGGFGEDKPILLNKTIGDIHSKGVKHINELVNNNIKQFNKEGVTDLIDLKMSSDFVVVLTDHKLYTKMEIAKANNIYAFSERGYKILIKIMEDEKSWEVYHKMLNEYFDMKEEKQNDIQPMSEWAMLAKMAMGMDELTRNQNILNNRTIKLEQGQKSLEQDNVEVKNVLRVTEIDQSQRKQLDRKRKARIYTIVGKGNDQVFYGEFLRIMTKALKEHFNLTSYETLHKTELENALDFIESWKPTSANKRDALSRILTKRDDGKLDPSEVQMLNSYLRSTDAFGVEFH